MRKIILLALLLTSCAKVIYHTPSKYMLRPAFLKAGDTVGVVAVSSKVRLDTLYDARFGVLESWGLNVKIASHLYDRDGGWFSASDTARAADLQRMIDDKSVKAILFYRGGYGAVRVLDYVDFSALARNPKWLAGFSDVTMIHYAAQKAGVESLHGTMPVSFILDTAVCDTSSISLRSALFGLTVAYKTLPHQLNQEGRATGRLVGGNLSLIYAADGTDVDNDLKTPSVLFIEEV